ncbi:MAG: hypothetical protein ACI85N_001838 [Gammaproteobacteria bacterium]|jgi:hypothetical protein
MNKIIFSILIAMLLAGVAVAEKKSEPKAATQNKIIKPSGFLGNYDDFKVINPQTNAKVWIKKPHEDLSVLKGYKAIVFSPIEVWMDQSSGYQGIDPNELKLITDYFLEQLQGRIGKTLEIVEKDGPDVMNLRIAITGIKKTKPKREVYDFIPVKLVWNAGNAGYRKLAGKHLNAYEATIEMEIRDTQSGDRLVAAMDKHSVNETTGKNEDTWAPLQEVLDYWAKIIGDRISQAQVM